jgi:arsenate reductase
VKRIAILLALLLIAADRPRTIVFVCEHGAARSVVAAAHFNRLAEQRHLPYRATARGTTPQPDLSPATVKGLREDGLEPPVKNPQQLSKDDVASAERVIAFCEIPDDLAKGHTIERWQAPAIGDGYAKARDVIVAQLEKLAASLEQK